MAKTRSRSGRSGMEEQPPPEMLPAAERPGPPPVPEAEAPSPEASSKTSEAPRTVPDTLMTVDRCFRARMRVNPVVMAFVRNERLQRVRKMTRTAWTTEFESFKSKKR